MKQIRAECELKMTCVTKRNTWM